MIDDSHMMIDLLEGADIPAVYMNGSIRVFDEEHVWRARRIIGQLYSPEFIPDIYLDDWSGEWD